MISSSARCKLFDHKQISLFLNPSLRASKPKSSLSNSFLNDILLRASVELEARRLHIFSLELENNIHIQDHGPILLIKETEMEKIRLCRNTINAPIKIRESISSGTYNRLQDLDLQGRERDIELQLVEMIPLNALEKIAKRCSSTEFFKLLVDIIRKAGVKMQKTLARMKGIQIQSLENYLKDLKLSYDGNLELIVDTENKL